MPGDVAHGDQPVLFATALLVNEDLDDPARQTQQAVGKMLEEMQEQAGLKRMDLVVVAIAPGSGQPLRTQVEDRILGINQTWCKCGHKEGQHYPGITAPRLCDVKGCECDGFEAAG